MAAHRLTEKNVKEALERCVGNLSAAARALGVARSSVAEYIARRPNLVALRLDLKEARIDNAESSLDLAVAKGEGWAVCFLLKTQGQDRGYIEKQKHEHTGPNGLPIQTESKHEHKIDPRAFAAFVSDLSAAGFDDVLPDCGAKPVDAAPASS